MNAVQKDFRGGMSAVFDSTKTGDNMFRCGLNTSIRKNSLSGFYKPVRITSPDAIHQAVFALDTALIAIIAGKPYLFNESDNAVAQLSSDPILSTTVDTIYHATFPVPANMLVNQIYQSTVSTFTPAAVLQDGANRPYLIGPALGVRAAGLYEDWTYENPEYIPIGKQMALSGNKLFIASPDGKRIYQSVSGRCSDFVLNFNSITGVKQGDAETTSTAVSAATLTAILPAQEGGFLAFTRYGSHYGEPRPDYPTVFGEVYISPKDLFPVGAVNQQSFTIANGESVFISPAGIQAFNQVAQSQTESNATIFGAPISDFLIKPITRCACITAAEYSFFGFSTIYGDAILVFDNRLAAWAGMLIGYSVKEFAVLNATGQERLFFITYNNELYELPLFSGTKLPYTAYLGEYTVDPHQAAKAVRVSLNLNNIRASGNVQVAFYSNRKQVATCTQQLTAERTSENFDTIPVDFPTEGETQSEALHFDPPIETFGQSLGLRVSVEAEADLTAVSLEFINQERATRQVTLVTPDEFAFLGSISPDNTYTANAQSVAVGNLYIYWNTAEGGQLLNGKDVITTYAAYECASFIAKADRVYFDSGQVLDFQSARTLLSGSSRPVLLGDLGNTTRPHPLLKLLSTLGKHPLFTLGDYEHTSTDQLRAAYGFTGITNFYKHETDNIRMFLLTFDVGDPTAPEWESDGPWATQIGRINEVDPSKPVIVCFHQSPYTATSGETILRWPFKRLGVHAVITGDGDYYRTYQNGVTFARSGGLAGILNLKAHSHGLDFTYETLAGIVNDRFFIPR